MNQKIESYPIEKYHENSGLSRSGIMEFKKSPLHYWNAYFNTKKVQKKPSEAMIIGNCAHTRILEPNTFDDRYYVFEKVNRTTKAGKEAWQNILDNVGNKILIDNEQFDTILSMEKSVLENKYVKQILNSGLPEISYFWEDVTDVKLKCRPDYLKENLVIDLKTCDDASPEAFQRDLYRYGYHIQAALIQDGLYAVDKKTINDFIYVVVESKPPFATAIYMLAEEALKKGKDDYKRILPQFKKCLESNEWVSYEPQVINLPRYAYL